MSADAKPRPLDVAKKDWERISLELRVFSEPKVVVRVTRRTTVAGKWIFIERD